MTHAIETLKDEVQHPEYPELHRTQLLEEDTRSERNTERDGICGIRTTKKHMKPAEKHLAETLSSALREMTDFDETHDISEHPGAILVYYILRISHTSTSATRLLCRRHVWILAA